MGPVESACEPTELLICFNSACFPSGSVDISTARLRAAWAKARDTRGSVRTRREILEDQCVRVQIVAPKTPQHALGGWDNTRREHAVNAI